MSDCGAVVKIRQDKREANIMDFKQWHGKKNAISLFESLDSEWTFSKSDSEL